MEIIVLNVADAADFLQIIIAENGLGHLQPLQTGCAFKVEQVRARADERHKRHHQFLTDRVDRRVRHLGKILFEISVKRLRFFRQCRDRRVGAHGASALFAIGDHRGQQEFQIFLRIAEGFLLVEHGEVSANMGLAFRGGQVFQLNLGARQPFFVRMRRRQRGFNFVIADDAAFFKVNQQHFAGLQAPFFDDFLFCHGQHAHFRSHHHAVIRGYIIARRAQAVSVQRGPDLATIGKGDSGWPVPRLHQRGVIFVKRAALIIH